MSIRCDICNGILVIDVGGTHARCLDCGMPHSIERVKEKLNKSHKEERVIEIENDIIVPNLNGDNRQKIRKNKDFLDQYLFKEEEEKVSEEKDFILSKDNQEEIEMGVIVKYVGDASHIVMPNGCESFGKYNQGKSEPIFKYPEKVKSIKFSDDMYMVGSNAFRGCCNIEEIYFPSNIEYFGYSLEIDDLGVSYAFDGCTNLRKVEFDPKAWNFTADNCRGLFKNCKSLKEVKLPQTLHKIPPSFLENCESLEEIVIPEEVAVIGQNAFKNCKKLKNVVLPKHGMMIHPTAFEGCIYTPPKAYTEASDINKCPVCNRKLNFWGHCKICHRDYTYLRKINQGWEM